MTTFPSYISGVAEEPEISPAESEIRTAIYNRDWDWLDAEKGRTFGNAEVWSAILADQSIPREDLFSVLRRYPELQRYVTDKSQATRFGTYILESGTPRDLENGRSSGLFTPEVMTKAITDLDKFPRDENWKWILDNMRFTPEQVTRFTRNLKLRSTELIALTAVKMPMGKEAHTELLSLMDWWAGEPVVSAERPQHNVPRVLGVDLARLQVDRSKYPVLAAYRDDLAVELEELKDQLSPLRYFPEGKIVLSDKILAAIENSLRRYGWMLKSYNDKYGPVDVDGLLERGNPRMGRLVLISAAKSPPITKLFVPSAALAAYRQFRP